MVLKMAHVVVITLSQALLTALLLAARPEIPSSWSATSRPQICSGHLFVSAVNVDPHAIQLNDQTRSHEGVENTAEERGSLRRSVKPSRRL